MESQLPVYAKLAEWEAFYTTPGLTAGLGGKTPVWSKKCDNFSQSAGVVFITNKGGDSDFSASIVQQQLYGPEP